MKINANRNYAVITGDIIGFKQLSLETRQSTYGLMARCSARIRKIFKETIAYDISMFRGDGWQMLVAEPRLCLRAALFVRAFLIASSPAGSRLDTRMAIGIGGIDYVPAKNVTAGDGEAFRTSGKKFDLLGKSGGPSLACANPGFCEEGRMDKLAALAGRVADQWQPEQADTFVRLLEHVGNRALAKKLPGPSHPKSASKLSAFDWIELVHILTGFEMLFP
ncbi:MAG: hypothetical protein GXP53_12270 [Deltaproteobacteria bacterium]|nr:hypothetical protein [Deltaproteobacteria bacterium]